MQFWLPAQNILCFQVNIHKGRLCDGRSRHIQTTTRLICRPSPFCAIANRRFAGSHHSKPQRLADCKEHMINMVYSGSHHVVLRIKNYAFCRRSKVPSLAALLVESGDRGPSRIPQRASAFVSRVVNPDLINRGVATGMTVAWCRRGAFQVSKTALPWLRLSSLSVAMTPFDLRRSRTSFMPSRDLIS